jgi:hypothetical protein
MLGTRARLLWLTVLVLTLLLVAVQPAEMDDEVDDPTNIVNDQIAAVGSVSATTSDSDTERWLNDMDEVLSRVALGALPALPPNAFTALDTLNVSVATAARLERSPAVVRAVLHLVPSLWAMAFWYVPLNEWKPAFGSVFSRSVAAAKRADQSALYDAAVNATARVVRFTKDNIFFDGQDHGDELQPPSKEYMEFLPTLVAQTSKIDGWRISEPQLREFMDKQLHSKLDGMDLTVAYPTFVDTAVFWEDDADKIKALVAQDAPQA